MSERRASLVFLLVALGVFGGLTAYLKRRPPPPAERPSWQRPVDELTAPQQALYLQLRGALRSLLERRNADQRWPASAAGLPESFQQHSAGHVVNYVGEGEGLRWLLLVLEPDPRLPREPAPPEDDEHFTLADGTGLHITVWTQPLTEPPPPSVTAFPAAEGWVERVRGTPAPR